jgi:hypothetical protein
MGFTPGNPGSYTATLTFSTKSSTHFAYSCLIAYGDTPTCDDLTAQLTKFYMAMPPATAAFTNIACASGAPDGCDCSYGYTVVVTDSGAWSTSGATLFEDSNMLLYAINGMALDMPGASGAPSQVPAKTMEATYCVAGNQLTLSGANGSSLSGVTGLRTMTLQPM